MKQRKIVPAQRKKALQSFLDDAKKLGFAKKVVKELEKQLREVEKQISEEKKKRSDWRKKQKKEGEKPSSSIIGVKLPQELILVDKRLIACLGETIRGLKLQVNQLEGIAGENR